jgi:hypothetical protein
MTDKSPIFIFIVASFEEKAYKYFIKMRKLQLAKYNIPHKFLFDGPCPDDYTPDENDVFYNKPQPPFPIPVEKIPYPEINPHMIIKFMKAIKDPEFNPSQYKYILRINLSTFINFPKLFELLPTLPTSNCCAAHSAMIDASDWSEYRGRLLRLVSGTAQIFTPDFIKWFSDTVHFANTDIYQHNDDVVISHFVALKGLQVVPLTLSYDRNDTSSVLIRLKSPENRFYDVASWAYLLKAIDDITFLQ